jgi:formyl-CoA transferase
VCKALDLEHLTDDPRFTTIEARSKNAQDLVTILDERFASRPRNEWLTILNQAECICTPVQTPKEVSDDPQALANNYFVHTDHPAHGRTKVVGFPWHFSETDASCRLPAPELGQHTVEILADLGYSTLEVNELREKEVI